MNIAEMHVWFRQYAQQMGLQNVRAILPEQIDILINTSIKDILNEIIQNDINTTNDRVINDNTKLSQINAFSTLYQVMEAEAQPLDTFDINVSPFEKMPESFVFRQQALLRHLRKGRDDFDYLYLVSLALNYKGADASGNEIITNYYPVRIIDDTYLADVLNDFILRPRVRTPIAVIYGEVIDLYIDVIKNSKLPENLVPNKLRVSYIAKPAEVKYVEDLGGKNIDCNLPEYLHVTILKHAVDLYRIAVSGALHANQGQEQAQQDNAR